MYSIQRRRTRKYGVAILALTALVLGACGQQGAQTEDGGNGMPVGIPIVDSETQGDNPVGGWEDNPEINPEKDMESSPENDPENSLENIPESMPESSDILQPVYLGDWEVVEYRYPTSPCGLSQEEVDALTGGVITYTDEYLYWNHQIVQSEAFGYDFTFYESLAEYEREYNASISDWFADGDTGRLVDGHLALEENRFGCYFAYMDEQPDKMVIIYEGVLFLAVNHQAEPAVTTGSARYDAYLNALKDMLFYLKLPLCESEEWEYFPVPIYFALQDIDLDGREELLIDHQGSIMATVCEMVYDYDEAKDQVYEEISNFPQISFYTNGYARADWSHNQTRSDFWPYFLYQYDPNSDRYEYVAMVRAWDKELSETNEEGSVFPDEVDSSGTGRVYLIEDLRTNQELEPMDVTEYDKWYTDMIGQDTLQEISIEWQLLDGASLKSLQSRLMLKE